MERQKLKNIVILNYCLISLLGIISGLLTFIPINIWISIPIIIVVFIITIKLRIYEEELRDKIIMDSDVEKMELILRNLYNLLGFREDDSVSITIHKKVDDTHYERYTRTIKHNSMKEDKGQSFEIKKGIVRLAFERSSGEDVFCDTFKDDTDKYVDLIDKYHYEEEEAKTMLQDSRKSYYCRTIVHNDCTWGVFYMTSSQYRGFYNTKGQLKQDMDKKIVQTIEFIQNEIL